MLPQQGLHGDITDWKPAYQRPTRLQSRIQCRDIGETFNAVNTPKH
jgi:hypothetical protein